MRNTRNNEYSDRLSAAVVARATLLKACRMAKEAIEPAREAKQAERLMIAQAREMRRVERETAKLDEQNRKLDEQNRISAETALRDVDIAAAAKAEIEAHEMATKNRIARVLEDEAARKAERDRRYANRKARQG